MGNVEVTEKLISGMTKVDLAIVIACAFTAFASMVGVLAYLLRLHLKPLSGLPDQVTQIAAKVKSESELDRMIKTEVLNHELKCPLRQKDTNHKNEAKK